MALMRGIVRATTIAFIGVALLAAFSAGGFAFLVRKLPSYQDDIQAWVTAKLGLTLDFARLEGGWGWRGPEIAFREVSVRAAGDETPFLTARGASVGFNVLDLGWRLATGREIAIDRLTFDGTEFTLVRNEQGAYRLQGAPAISGEQATVQVPPDIDVLVRDSRVLYLDDSRSVAWAFQDVTASLRRDDEVLTLEAQALPPVEFASHIDIAAQAVVGDDDSGAKFTGEWRMSADLDEVDLAVAAQLFPPSAVAPRAGRGDVAVWLELQGGAVKSGTVELALADVALQSTLGTVDSRFERIAFSGTWEQSDEALRLSLHDVAVTRSGRAWPEAATVDIDVGRDRDGVNRVALRSSFLRLEDLTPFFAPLPESRVLESWFALAPRGDLRAVDVALTRNADARVEYSVAAQFQGLGVDRFEDAPGITGLTGQVRADSRAGRLELASEGAALDWPALFRSALSVPELKGIVVWRAGQDAVRVVSDDLLVATPAASLRTNLELTLPMDDSSARLDLRTSVSEFDIAAAPRYLPANKMPATVVAWLDSALRGGRAKSAEVTFVGPVRAFPFDGGEGEFRATLQVEDVVLAFVKDWPAAEELDGTVEFVNARFAARGSGRVLGNRTADVRVGIGDLRAGDFTLQAETIGGLDQVLAFLNGAPLIAGYLGEDFARLEAPSGTAATKVDLALPLRDRDAYRLTAGLDIIDGELAYRGFGPQVS
ncbi:MAG TPA: DUF3971 domain-containing protein, partial [Gammaproteobacteria bacterium]|nr:DUF3971 domain-containing protein [Gammaproteobacteria bacterium]